MLVVAGLLALTATATATAASGRLALQRLVVAEARNMGVAPGLALAVAHAESDFNPKVRSHKGARGIMQIMPRTAWEEYGIVPEQLWQPRINVRLGLHFLKRLLRRYHGRVDLALSYYNGGSAVGDLPRARIIPATYPYVRKVRKLRLNYRRMVRKGTYDE
ncbi:MAG: lytic transglycosylase domain-containing protein [Rhodospirillaceae bacterium]|jgi:soluble lytic murein transglycosylase-like protein|nr:lytic transglycosylase domain-containing protein [Rhodospirillaceae bacterium]MBT3491723.1 lytic transglycosylase domain-containing protein [Rhodospirillaceae bacterium]MBT3783221.1 lytic transglycosylase domain-containing protein [Rhodospirillaceae bacterium]MBT3978217.1 lytic transglycosylase domain-containing protein [Rhodospirillaceae bacterium]MBT4169747.1 lytic transglycosylase domain-containing protein [Rhodospirillaceae bacterium]